MEIDLERFTAIWETIIAWFRAVLGAIFSGLGIGGETTTVPDEETTLA